ncbi:MULTISPECIES: arylsulfatase [unclassified Ensifer]|uniref:arylsulfatase n=1 Tax=unclassified Ensifer TaxID=2633371 RepID=UPI000813A69A|nr:MULTISPECIES: arylsulfatase [unclassified Ensifer]OCP00727.1 arylsulfatase [Ensifer sp. LC14]OCP04586.1 arylsulfatase [Ensifer sp. LC11]OCP09638.1 arylsulfatase [Ensifer sp. LC13]OCP30684.1 arylsulfatase [Ensifer sp. LC499]
MFVFDKVTSRRFLSAVFSATVALAGVAPPASAQTVASDGSVLPFPPQPMKGVAKPRLQDSTMEWPATPERLPAGAPNILIVLLDDVGFGVSEAFGGEVRTPTLSRLASEGISFTGFNTTSICSPSRAALLTGRNHTRVGSGTIAERAVAFDGYTGVIPKTAATVAEVLKNYGYHTSAFGKWHNTPATETTAIGPKDHWPNAYGFEYFYGFLGGETSQWEPRLTENYDAVEPPHDDPKYHLTEDMVDKALKWLDDYRAYDPDKPFLMYWAPGGAHGPHHVFPEWADKYKGKFNSGWDAYRERTYKRQLDMRVIPANTKLTERDPTMASWDSIPESQRPFQERLMEIFAGFVEHTDVQVGRLIDGMESRGLKDNTLVFYIFGDNGSSAEGQQGSISELLAQNNIENTVEEQMAALDKIGGLDALGTGKTDNMYHAGWAWAGGTPFKGTKLMAGYFGGTRNPMVVSWPGHIKHDGKFRQQFHHVVDIAPTIYEILGIKAPKSVNGYEQLPIDGTSLAYTFANADAAPQKLEQFFDNNGSRGLYLDGWFADVPGPFTPWDTPGSAKRLASWDSAKDEWELYDLKTDFSQAENLAAANPGKLAEMKKRFLDVAEENKDFPIGAGNWLRLHPEDRIKSSYDKWTFSHTTRRMPEFAAPGVGRESTDVRIDAEFGENANGVLYAVGGAGGGLSVYMQDGELVYEYNMMIIENYQARTDKIPAGKHRIEISTAIPKPAGPAEVVITVDGKEAAKTTVRRTVPAAFTATESFDVGADLGSPVSQAYADKRPFAFDGKIGRVDIELAK